MAVLQSLGVVEIPKGHLLVSKRICVILWRAPSVKLRMMNMRSEETCVSHDFPTF
jgi:hypothetical protein